MSADLSAAERRVLDAIDETELVATLCEHAAGNYRALMTMANDLLVNGAQREVKHLAEKLFFDSYTPTSEPTTKSVATPSKRR